MVLETNDFIDIYMVLIKPEGVVEKLTEAERAGKASDDSNSIFWVSAKLQENRREGIPFALQLQQIKNKLGVSWLGWKPVTLISHYTEYTM